jgi:serine/threonine-protein kinase
MTGMGENREGPLRQAELATKAGGGPPPSHWAEASEFAAPSAFQGYEVVDVLGRGGMGVVYRARQLSLGRCVAIKVMLAGAQASPEERLRFRVEAESVALLCHPNIVQVYEVGEQNGYPFCSLEYVDGGSLAEKLRGGPMPAAKAAQLVEKLARAVDAAHRHGIIHRDLKPPNILLTADGEPKIADFGLAKRMGDTFDQTRTGAGLGTPSYMAPEQVEAAKGVGPAADIYGLGAILYETLTGHPPFEGPSAMTIMARVLSEEPMPPRKRNPAIPRDAAVICLKCLEKDPRRRYPSAAALGDDLLSFFSGDPIMARPPGMLGRFDRWARLRPAVAATLSILALFYMAHLALIPLGVRDEGGAYHRFITGALLSWAVAAVTFQRLYSRTRRVGVLFAWIAFDILMLTLVIYRGDGPHSALVPGYFLLIAGTGLRLRIYLVWFATGVCLAGYFGLLLEAGLRRPEFAVDLKEWVITALSMAALGLIQYILLRRVGIVPERDP